MLLEADPDGGVVAPRAGLSLAVSLAELAATGRHGLSSDILAACSVALDGSDATAVVAPAAAESTAPLLRRLAEPLAVFLASEPTLDVIADVGRLSPRSPAGPLAREAAVTVVVCRPEFEQLATVQPRVEALLGDGCKVGLVVVDSRPESPPEMAAALDIPLLGVLPHDRRTAAAVCAGRLGSRAVRRSPWWRTVGEIGRDVLSADEPVAARGVES